jgi:hypothetical protein
MVTIEHALAVSTKVGGVQVVKLESVAPGYASHVMHVAKNTHYA